MDILEYSSCQYRQAFTIKSNKPCRFKNFQEYPRCSQNLGYSWNFLNMHELFGFSGKSLLRERMAEIILGKCEFKTIYQFFLNSHSQ